MYVSEPHAQFARGLLERELDNRGADIVEDEVPYLARPRRSILQHLGAARLIPVLQRQGFASTPIHSVAWWARLEISGQSSHAPHRALPGDVSLSWLPHKKAPAEAGAKSVELEGGECSIWVIQLTQEGLAGS